MALAPSYGPYAAELISVHDGDTIRVRLDVGFETDSRPRLRLKDLRSPEIWNPGGVEARDYVRQLLHETPAMIVRTFRTGPIAYVYRAEGGEERRTFIRYVADVWLPERNDFLQALVAAGGHGTYEPV